MVGITNESQHRFEWIWIELIMNKLFRKWQSGQAAKQIVMQPQVSFYEMFRGAFE